MVKQIKWTIGIEIDSLQYICTGTRRKLQVSALYKEGNRVQQNPAVVCLALLAIGAEKSEKILDVDLSALVDVGRALTAAAVTALGLVVVAAFALLHCLPLLIVLARAAAVAASGSSNKAWRIPDDPQHKMSDDIIGAKQRI